MVNDVCMRCDYVPTGWSYEELVIHGLCRPCWLIQRSADKAAAPRVAVVPPDECPYCGRMSYRGELCTSCRQDDEWRMVEMLEQEGHGGMKGGLLI